MTKPVSRVRAAERAARLNDAAAQRYKTKDSYQNFGLNLGQGTNNALSESTYGYNPVTLIRPLLEWIHRGTWLGGAAVDLVADDMTRAGVDFNTTLPPDGIDGMHAALSRLGFWSGWNSALKWARLYGGSLLVMLIEGQDLETPLRLETIAKGQLKGFLVLDRWQVEASMNSIVQDFGPYIGKPMFYKINSQAPALSGKSVHYSRVIRCDGIELPYYQKLSNNLWDLSVIERLYDRMVAFDSATTGVAQLTYKSYLRTLKLEGLRDANIAGGDALAGMLQQVEMMRKFQSLEGISLIDAEDELTVDGVTSFSGLAEALGQLAQQISGALQIPLARLMSQSPSGFNEGDNDVRNYFDGINHQQERYREPVSTVFTVVAKSEGIALPADFGFTFTSLWQLDDVQKADIATKHGVTVGTAMSDGIIGRKTALMELRNSSRITGVFSTITDEQIEDAEEDPPAPGGEVDENGDPLPSPDDTAETIPSENAAKPEKKDKTVENTSGAQES